jgi:DNA (cytosine-5)-methyltransferase 1
MTGPLVLSLFPGIGLLDHAFEQEGFCIVRGPDLLWGGDIKLFHPPARVFDGIIGGSPCQAFSTLVNLVLASGHLPAEDLIPEFVRCVDEAQPTWWLHENTERAPSPWTAGYTIEAPLFNNRWIGGEQSRRHRFTFGSKTGARLTPHLQEHIVALENHRWSPRVLASGGDDGSGHSAHPRQLAGGNRNPRHTADGRVIRKIGKHVEITLPNGSIINRAAASYMGRATTKYFQEAKRLQGLPPEWDLPGFTVAQKVRALGNGVPLPMGRALARAVKKALAEGNPGPSLDTKRQYTNTNQEQMYK